MRDGIFGGKNILCKHRNHPKSHSTINPFGVSYVYTGLKESLERPVDGLGGPRYKLCKGFNVSDGCPAGRVWANLCRPSQVCVLRLGGHSKLELRLGACIAPRMATYLDHSQASPCWCQGVCAWRRVLAAHILFVRRSRVFIMCLYKQIFWLDLG